MDDPHKQSSQSAEIKNVLPDVVHSQQIPAVAGAASDETESAEIATSHSTENNNRNVQETSETESISEHIPSKVEDSLTESENVNHVQEPQALLKVDTEQEKVSKTNSLNIPYAYSPISENPSLHDPSKQSSSWPIDVNAMSDLHPNISEESPVNLALSSDLSKEGGTQDKSPSVPQTPLASDQESPEESPRSDKYVDSLNEESFQKSLGSENDKSLEQLSNSLKDESLDRVSSGSEEIIKLDIRGQGVPKFPLPTAKIIFGPPPEGSTILDPNIESIPVFQNLLSPFLVGAGDGIKLEEVFDFSEQQAKEFVPDKSIELSPDKSLEILLKKSLELSNDKQSVSSGKSEEQDLLVEELTVDDVRQKVEEKQDEPQSAQPKSIPAEEMSFSTMTTDYKTICEEYHAKLVHFEDAITQRDELIEELTVSLQRSVRERDELRHENEHLTNEVHQLQHVVGERSSSDHDTIKAQLSDFVKYQSMVKDDSTKFYSALMSGGSSIQSSNGEKDMDHEEITVNYSKSDLRSSGSSETFDMGFEGKLTTIINKFDEYIEENLRNTLRESIIQLLCDEIGKMRIEFDTEVKELEGQLQQDKQGHTVETRRLRELLASVKAGNADIDALRQELSVKHEKEMENLRTYFEKKCSDMERSYSEEVWRGRVCASPGSGSSLDAPDAAGDHARRRTRSAELPSLTLSLESTPLEQAVKQACRKYEQQVEEAKAEHLAHVSELQARHAETVASFEEQITQLKAHIQTSENTEANVSLYQQDIDLELEKRAALESRVAAVRQEVAQELQEKLQVLLSDPDAEVSSWPVELVALRDKIHGDVARLQHEKELSSLRDELSGGEDKWKQRRNLSFDQNRHLEEVTKERDGLKRVAVSLHRVVGQLVAYCASAEDELNRTVLAHLLGRILPNDSDETFADEESRPCTPNASTELNTSVVSKHVHFAPDLPSILAELDEESVVGFLQQQRDLSADIKRELESSLKRLRQEAHELLDLSAKLGNKSRNESKMLESSQVQITELVQDLDTNRASCDNCELHRKNMEEAMAECLQRENLLRSDLEAAMIKIAQFMTSGEGLHSTDLIAEGYGTLGGQAVRPSVPRPRAATPGCTSLDGCASPRGHAQRMARDLDLLQRERDDLEQQLEAANRQLRSTRAFVEEQAAEREAERDEFARRLHDLRDENARLTTRLQNNARILNEVEQLEAQTREMNQIIHELETRKAASDDELKATEEKITLLRDIIANLEGQLEQKSAHEADVVEQLETMKKTIDERDGKMRSLLGELESMRSERAEQSEVVCVRCGSEEDKYAELMEKVKEQCRWLEERIHRRTQRLERVHDVGSASCSEPSEDVSLRDQRDRPEVQTPESPPTPRNEHLVELIGVWDGLQAHARAEDAALKRIRDLEMQRTQLKDVAQEVRAERDVLQARMSEQALRISSLSARLQQQRNDAEALAHHASSQLSVQLHDALAEVQKLKEDLESKDKQLQRLKQNLEEKDKLNEQHQSLYGNSCNPKDKVVILERELSSAQSRIAQLEGLARSLEADKDELHSALRDHQRALAEKEEQLQELLALKLDDDNEKEPDAPEGAKTSARTLSDIVSISEFDEHDLQMRRDNMRAHLSLTFDEPRDRPLDRTLPPDLQKAHMSSLRLEYIDADERDTPRADSLPAQFTSTQNKEMRYKRNVNETTMFGMDKFGECLKQSPAAIPDNCSMYPNRNVSENKDLTVEPKKINFSVEPSQDNRTHDEDYTSLGELGISLDVRQENFPDILTQLKHEIKKSRSELENCKSELKNAEEQLCEFPALKEEVEELKGLLENTMATMETDKKFYENQLENFSSNKKLLEQRLTELTQEVGEKCKDLHLLKEDILRRENMILELAKEKRNLTNKLAELEMKIDELQSRNSTLEKCESENHQMREKMLELQKLEQLVSEKNHQIDSLNQHLDRLDDLQRRLDDKTEELDNLKEAFEEKSSELFQTQDAIEALNRDIVKLTEDNRQLSDSNKELKLRLSKVEKEQENASLKLQNSETELERANSLNSELTSKIEELKLLTDKLKDKETEIEILHEDINSFHEEIASLKEQLKMVSRSPSPRSKEDRRPADRHAASDKKQLVKIRKQISLLQHELDFNKKELNDKAFELAKAKLDVTELKNSLGQANRQTADKELANSELQQELQQLAAERDQLAEQLDTVSARIREESNISELKAKLRDKVQRCHELERELQDMKDLVDRLRSAEEADAEVMSHTASQRALVVSGSRSPTAELERALRDQLNYSHTLDEDIMEQILSASSDDHEDIPRLALNTSKSSSSIHSSSSERLNRLRVENDKLQMQLNNLELRLKDKDALIAELNRIRDKLVSDWQTSKLRYEAERDNVGRLQLLLQTHKECAESLQNQDSNMIQILKKRLESAMQSEVELQQQLQQQRARVAQLERQLISDDAAEDPLRPQLQHELEKSSRLAGEVSVLKSKLEVERARASDAQAAVEHVRARSRKELDAARDAAAALKGELADVKRLKHEASIELLRAKELLTIQSDTISELEKKLIATTKQKPVIDALTEIENHKTDLARDIAALKKCLSDSPALAAPPALAALRAERDSLARRLQQLQSPQQQSPQQQQQPDERDQAVRYLHGRCLRLESCRKALVWQKRYLQRVLLGYGELERTLRPPPPPPPAPLKRFKCAALCVTAFLRMSFLVRRRVTTRALSAHCLLRAPGHATPAHAHAPSHGHAQTPVPAAATSSQRHLAGNSPPSRDRPDRGRPRRLLRHDLALHPPASPSVDDFVRRSPFNVNSPHNEPFILSSPRGEAAAYLNKLELVSRCLGRAMEPAP